MDAYIYQAALYCENCGLKIQNELIAQDTARQDTWIEESDDSNSYPQGPYPDGGGEADYPQHCDGCRIFLENPLTKDGEGYVKDEVNSYVLGKGEWLTIQAWKEYYDYLFPFSFEDEEDQGT